MSQQMNQPNPGPPGETPVKRKRGRPRKDETQAQAINRSTLALNKPPSRPMVTRTQGEESAAPKPTSSTTIASKGKDHIEVDVDQVADDEQKNDEMVGQVVTGVLESAFDAGYFLTVRVGESDVCMRGVVFKEACVVPVTPENDIAPNAKMYKRRDIPIPVKLAPQAAQPAGNSSSKPTDNIEEHHLQPQSQPPPHPQLQLQPQPQPEPQLHLQPQPLLQPQLQPQLQLQLQPQPQPQLQLQLQPQPQPQPQPQLQQHQQQQQMPIESVPQKEVQNVVLFQGQSFIPLNIEQQHLPVPQEQKLPVDNMLSVASEEQEVQNPQVVYNPNGRDVKGLPEGPLFESGLASLDQSEQNPFLKEPTIIDGGENERVPETSEAAQTGDQIVFREDIASQVVNEPHCNMKEKRDSPRNDSLQESSEPLPKMQKTDHETVSYPSEQPLNDAFPGAQNPEEGPSESAVKADEIAATVSPREVLIQPEPTFAFKEPGVMPQVVEPEIGGVSGFQISMENTDNDEPFSENPSDVSPVETE